MLRADDLELEALTRLPPEPPAGTPLPGPSWPVSESEGLMFSSDLPLTESMLFPMRCEGVHRRVPLGDRIPEGATPLDIEELRDIEEVLSRSRV